MSGYTTLEFEDAIANCPQKGYIYFYYGDHNFPKEINDACEKIVSIDDYNKIIPKFNKMINDGSTIEDDDFSKLVTENEELFEAYKKVVLYVHDNSDKIEKEDVLDDFHIADSSKKIYGYYIDELVKEDEMEITTLTVGIVRVKKEFFDRYPIQARQRFCNIINSIYNIGIWFEKGKNKTRQ